MDDQILIKTDGMPTYNFANVVDDHLMGITHVIRGSEYLSSTPKYNLLYQAFGWEIPTYIHCPPVMKDAQNKLSKRNGDASYQDLVAKGYLSDAILNYICLLGWSPKGEYAEQEIFSLPELVKIWTPDGISKSPAIFDPLKLRAINAEYIRRLSPEDFQKAAEPWIDQAVHTPIDKKLLCANLQPRCEVLGEIPAQLDFFDALPDYDVSLYTNKKQKTTPDSAKEALEALLPVLEDEALDFTNRDAVFEACKAKAEELGKKNGWLLYPLGIALSGKQRTPRRRHRPGLHDGPRDHRCPHPDRSGEAERVRFCRFSRSSQKSPASALQYMQQARETEPYKRDPRRKAGIFFMPETTRFRPGQPGSTALAARAAVRPRCGRGPRSGWGLAGGWAVLYGALLPFGLGLTLGLPEDCFAAGAAGAALGILLHGFGALSLDSLCLLCAVGAAVAARWLWPGKFRPALLSGCGALLLGGVCFAFGTGGAGPPLLLSSAGQTPCWPGVWAMPCGASRPRSPASAP